MEVESEPIVEEREEFMVSPSGGNPIRRKAHFLSPCSDSPGPFSKLHSLSASSFPVDFDPKICSSVVRFTGWKFPPKNWGNWVIKMASLHEPTWRKAGIFEAILNSTCKIGRNNDLVFGVAEKWYKETKSFIFPWGEATITLEDVMILGEYSVSGSPVFSPVETEETKEIESKLKNSMEEEEISGIPGNKAQLWMGKFKDGDGDSKIEHVAFLALWLSRFVFPSHTNTINSRVFPIAIHLAKGTRISLAPAILASIYRDLSSLRNIISATRIIHEKKTNETLATTVLCAPLYLVQVWVWERFLLLRPSPNLLNNGESRMRRWNELKHEVKYVRSVLDSSNGCFDWRPYAKPLRNWGFPKFYGEREMFVCDVGVDEILISRVRSLRVSELLGLDSVEQYLPHRVARQFGLDQDLPRFIPRSNLSSDVPWDGSVFVPSRFCQGEVTLRYFEWWKESALSLLEQNASGRVCVLPKEIVETKEGHVFTGFLMVRKEMEGARKSETKKKRGSNASSSHRIARNFNRIRKNGSLSKILKGLDHSSARKDDDAAPASVPIDVDSDNSDTVPVLDVKKKVNSASIVSVSPPGTPKQVFDLEAQKELENSSFPPGFPPKRKTVEGNGFADEEMMSTREVLQSSQEEEYNDALVSSTALDSTILKSSNGDLEEVERKQMDISFPVRIPEEEVQEEWDNVPPVSNCRMVEEGCSIDEDDMTLRELLISMEKLGDANSLDEDPTNKAMEAEEGTPSPCEIPPSSATASIEKLMPKDDEKRSNRKPQLVVLLNGKRLVKVKRKDRKVQ